MRACGARLRCPCGVRSCVHSRKAGSPPVPRSCLMSMWTPGMPSSACGAVTRGGRGRGQRRRRASAEQERGPPEAVPAVDVDPRHALLCASMGAAEAAAVEFWGRRRRCSWAAAAAALQPKGKQWQHAAAALAPTLLRRQSKACSAVKRRVPSVGKCGASLSAAMLTARRCGSVREWSEGCAASRQTCGGGRLIMAAARTSTRTARHKSEPACRRHASKSGYSSTALPWQHDAGRGPAVAWVLKRLAKVCAHVWRCRRAASTAAVAPGLLPASLQAGPGLICLRLSHSRLQTPGACR